MDNLAMKMKWHFIWKVNDFIIHISNLWLTGIFFPLLEYDGGIIVEIKAPFYDDPPPPLLEKGKKIV